MSAPGAQDSKDLYPTNSMSKDDYANASVEPVPEDSNNGLQRKLQSRHLQMMALGGIIGPGYWIGTGKGLSNGGPAGMLIAFGTVGILLWCVMQSLGEMAAFMSVTGSFTNYTSRFIDPAIAFSLGWNYWLLWIGVIAAEYNNLGLVLTYWPSKMPDWGFILVFWVFFTCFVMLGVRSFGEAEFWLASIKVTFIFVYMLLAILITTGAIGTGGKVGFKFYHDPGAFADGPKGVFKVFVLASMLYAGTEMVGLTAGEAANPQRDIPRAVNMVFWRIMVLFLGAIFFMSLCVPWNHPDLLGGTSKTASSPYAISFIRAGMPRGGDFVTVVIIITILSAVNGALYVASRCLTAMAHEGKAPKFFGKTNKYGVPYVALIFCNLFGLLSLLNQSSSSGHVYTWLVTISGVATFISWACICWAHIRFRKALKLQGVSLDELPFRAPFFPYAAYFGLFGNLFFVFFQGWTAFLSPFSAEDFCMNYVLIPVFIIMAVSFKLVKKSKWVDLSEADIHTGRKEWRKEDTNDVENRPSLGKRIAKTIFCQ